VGRVRVREQNFDVATREASGDERTALWRELSAANRYLPRLQTKARRQLPLLLLTPTKAPGSNRAIEGGRGAARRSDAATRAVRRRRPRWRRRHRPRPTLPQ
jgi:hypothetical protein